jgi:GAF domain-containing protein
MVYSGELIGVLTVYEIDRGENSQKRKYTQADVDLLTMFAGTAAVAVYNQREGISPQLAAQTMV